MAGRSGWEVAAGGRLLNAVREFWYSPPGEGPWWRILAGPPLILAEAGYRSWLLCAKQADQLLRKATLKVSLPVVSVGNLTVGGAGKTSLCLALASLVESLGKKAAVVSHSYGREAGAEKALLFGGGAGSVPSWRRIGDEAAMMAREAPSLKVVAGADKARSLIRAAQAGVDLIIIDDAFHRRDIHRDLDVLVIDARQGFGNGHCLPRGPLREPPSALSRADLLVVSSPDGRIPVALEADVRCHNTRAPLIAAVKKAAGLVPWSGKETMEVKDISGRPVYAFCALGQPESFFGTLEESGVRLVGRAVFPDHHPYSGRDLSRLAAASRASGAEKTVTTAKDAVRIGAWPGDAPPLLALRIDLELIDPRRHLREKFRRLLEPPDQVA